MGGRPLGVAGDDRAWVCSVGVARRRVMCVGEREAKERPVHMQLV